MKRDTYGEVFMVVLLSHFQFQLEINRCMAGVSFLGKTKGVYSPFVKEPAFLVHWTRGDM